MHRPSINTLQLCKFKNSCRCKFAFAADYPETDTDSRIASSTNCASSSRKLKASLKSCRFAYTFEIN